MHKHGPSSLLFSNPTEGKGRARHFECAAILDMLTKVERAARWPVIPENILPGVTRNAAIPGPSSLYA